MRTRTYTKKDVVEITAKRSGHTFSTTFKIVDEAFVTYADAAENA